MNIKYPAAQFSMVLLQKMATRRQHFLMLTPFQFFPIIFSLFSFGIDFISDTAFVLGVQDLDSVMHSHVSSLSGSFSRIGDCSVFSKLPSAF